MDHTFEMIFDELSKLKARVDKLEKEHDYYDPLYLDTCVICGKKTSEKIERRNGYPVHKTCFKNAIDKAIENSANG